MRAAVLSVLAAAALVAVAAAPLRAQVILPPPPACTGFLYTVQPGDTLFLIAQRFGVSLEALIAANPQVPNPALIFPGQQICVPAVPPPDQTWVAHLQRFVGRNDVVVRLLGAQLLECDPVQAVFADHLDCRVGTALRHTPVASAAYFQEPVVPPTAAASPALQQQPPGTTLADHLRLTPFITLLTGESINCIFREVFVDHIDCTAPFRGAPRVHVRFEAIAYGEQPGLP